MQDIKYYPWISFQKQDSLVSVSILLTNSKNKTRYCSFEKKNHTVSKLQCANKTFLVNQGRFFFNHIRLKLQLWYRSRINYQKSRQKCEAKWHCSTMRDLCHVNNIIKEVLDVLVHQPTTVSKKRKKQRDMLSFVLNSNIWIARNFQLSMSEDTAQNLHSSLHIYHGLQR